ncbi:MAG: helix-turn-helix domain-containing protein [Prolixibacteraceae bacterium]|jgi:signal transduction histidine kinase/DNA-binding response OmpR family regulator/ligand-binding sensor domain-containing protein|nr:helix-turn-helix domain-containing protein [Prolixibacteraceae bacterium]
MLRLLKYIICFVVLFVYISATGQNLFFEQLTGHSSPNTSIHGIAKDSIGHMWFGSWNGLYRYDGEGFEIFRNNAAENNIPNNRIRNIITDDNKTLWVYTFDRKYLKFDYRFDNFDIVEEDAVPRNVTVLLNGSANMNNSHSIVNGYRYIIEANTLTAVHNETEDTITYHSDIYIPGSLKDDHVTYFFIDDQKMLWVGTRSGSIFKANTNRKAFTLHYCLSTINQQIQKASARVLLKTEDALYAGTNNNGIIQYQWAENQNTIRPAKTINAFESIRSMYMGHEKLWVGSTSGLYCYYTNSEKSESIISRDKTPGLSIWSVYAISQGNEPYIWVGLYDALARINTQNNRVEIINLFELINNHSIMHIHRDARNRLWLATEGSGIIRMTFDENLTPTDTVIINSTNQNQAFNLTGNMVYSLFEDQNGKIWAGTTNGLNCIDPQTLKVEQYTMENGLPDPYISAVTGDNSGNIWLSHKSGISKLEIRSGNISNYYISDNNIHWSFLDGACFNDSLTNTIYFGAREGYVSFNPVEIKEYPYPPLITLKSFSLSGKPLKTGEKINGKVVLEQSLSHQKNIELGYANRDFSIEMAALHYENPAENKYRYKLDGYTDEWIETSHNEATFLKVPAGKYVFRVKALSPENIESDEVILNIRIRSPWYATYWAMIVYFLILYAAFYLAYNILVTRIKLKNQLRYEKINAEKQAELNREKLNFFTNVSHELRTPLTLITDPLKQLQEKNISAEKRRFYYSVINKNIELLSRLINQLLDFRKAESGKLEAHAEICEVAGLINESLQSFEASALERNISLEHEYTSTEKRQAYLDKDKLRQVLLNVLSNALKYTPDGGKIGLKARVLNNNKLEIIISDNGIGITSEALEHIFEPFNNEGAQPFYGSSSGMGLAITHNFVQIMGGTIELTSTPNKGTAALIIVPFEPAPKTSETTPRVSPVEIPTTETPGIEDEQKNALPTLLIVEDNRDIQDYLAIELKKKFTLYQEFNGHDGLVSALENIPDVIISDIMMPGMDGIQLCHRIKSDVKTSHIPVILLTAKTTDQNRVDGLETGADVYISKPFSIDVLKAQLKSIITNRQRLQKQLSQKQNLEEITEEAGQFDHAFITQTISIIKENIEDSSFSTELLAEQLGISPRQLYRKLKAISGSTVYEFILRVRMDEATRLLSTSKMNVSEVAFKTGYSEPSNFSRTFKKHFGCNPSKYAKLHE